MTTEIVDTETVSTPLRRVKLGQQSFRVPTTPTIRYMFWMRGFLARFAENAITDDDIVDCYEQTVEFLRRYNTKVDEDELQASCELADLVTFYSRCFSADDDADEGDARPPRTRGGATRNGRAKTASKSRS